jgi:hypothetical protein
MERPVLEIDELLRTPQAGSMVLTTRTNVHFANFKYTKANTNALAKTYEIADVKGLIEEWELSNIQEKDFLHDQHNISPTHLKDLDWTTQRVESSGLLNIARYLKISPEKNTAVVRLKVKSDRRQTKEMILGYSDYVKVFVNGQAVYSGTNQFRTRDYRYLGTIGFFDAAYLPLKKGQNEIILVVSENFGGWGLQATLEDRTGISLK